MKLIKTKIEGAYKIEPTLIKDERGYLAKTYSADKYRDHGLAVQFRHSLLTRTWKKGSIRGMHFQLAPHGENKIIRCTRGAVLDVLIDIRRDSPTFMEIAQAELTSENHFCFYAPKGLAHGFQALTDDVEMVYDLSEDHVPESAEGVRYNDPAFNIAWPLPVTAISERDSHWPNFS